mmetsp:Transcript_118458/g.230585  ORF Transcript_118458/g.230585 Transcript_118458/m.230585 type:complete len:229 (+) Transcript_118458:27-713(+)
MAAAVAAADPGVEAVPPSDVPAESCGGTEALAVGLCNAVEAIVSPYEDVSGYLGQAVLPCLAPAIVELLHHVHESGELQRALQERAAEEQEQRRRSKESKEEERGVSRQQSIFIEEPMGLTPSPPRSAGPQPQAPQPQDDGAAAGSEDAEEPAGFDPLEWLAERLRKDARGSAGAYREEIQRIVMEHMANTDGPEEACGLLLEALEEGQPNAVPGDGSEPPGSAPGNL